MRYQKILIIDDDTEDQEIFTTALTMISENLECMAISSAREALEKLERKELRPDIIFLDLNMPIMSGQEFLIEAKQKTELKDIPVIIFSTSSSPATIKLTKDLGAENFITKPSLFDSLVTILKPILINS